MSFCSLSLSLPLSLELLVNSPSFSSSKSFLPLLSTSKSNREKRFRSPLKAAVKLSQRILFRRLLLIAYSPVCTTNSPELSETLSVHCQRVIVTKKTNDRATLVTCKQLINSVSATNGVKKRCHLTQVDPF